jgi:hypothetical protein
MKLTYIIMAHKLPEQLVRLVQRLDTPDATFLIHVDRKTDDGIYGQAVDSLGGYKNVHFMKRRRRYYGDFDHVAITLDGLCDQREFGIPFDYVLLLTGQDYPTRSGAQLQAYLAKHPGQSFMEYFPLPEKRWGVEDGGTNRFAHWHWNIRGLEFEFPHAFGPLRAIPLPLRRSLLENFPVHRKLPDGLSFFGGGAYWSLTRRCIEYVEKYIEGHPQVVKFFQYTRIPEEMFFQTILLNSPLRHTIVNDDLRYIAWTRSRHPTILRSDDYEKVRDSGKLFARKFDQTIDAAILDMIDESAP